MLELITKEDFDLVAKRYSNYYKPFRWNYYSGAIKLLKKIQVTNVLEIGPGHLPLVRGCDTMDRKEIYDPTYLCNAMHVPWPVQSNAYSVVIALQIWEHLHGHQVEAFQELMRITSQAVMSFPLEWNCPNNPNHHNITRERIAEWTLGVQPVEEIVIEKRLVILLRFR